VPTSATSDVGERPLITIVHGFDVVNSVETGGRQTGAPIAISECMLTYMNSVRAPDRERYALPVLDAIATTRSIHRYLPDPIPEGDLAAILFAATRAPSGGNAQPARWLVLRRTAETGPARALLGTSFRAAWAAKATREQWPVPVGDAGASPTASSSRRSRTAAVMQAYVDQFEHIPVVILACLDRVVPRYEAEGSSVYPGCQNILLAARALGYGATMSMWHQGCEAELRRSLHIPDDVFLAATITLGRPAGRHGPLRRRPMPEVVFDGLWGTGADWIGDRATRTNAALATARAVAQSSRPTRMCSPPSHATTCPVT
jgi:nitroreductase